jgi:hypothetical protein
VQGVHKGAAACLCATFVAVSNRAMPPLYTAMQSVHKVTKTEESRESAGFFFHVSFVFDLYYRVLVVNI